MKKVFEESPILDNGTTRLRKLDNQDVEGIQKILLCEDVYRYVPSFVPEKQCNGDIGCFINTICQELWDQRIEMILGIYSEYSNYELCGLLELYHYDPEKLKISIGGRLAKEFWNKGISTDVISLITDYLFYQTNITTICASNMVDNPASGRILEKNGFIKIEDGVFENWGFSEEVPVDKWVLTKKIVNH